MVTAYGDVDVAVAAMRTGASDYVAKPVELSDLVLRVRRIAAECRLRERLHQAEAELGRRQRLLPPRSEVMREVLATLERVARLPQRPVLLVGERGTGKEVIAAHLHRIAHAPEAPFVRVSCRTSSETELADELFGRGRRTPTVGPRRGLVELADGGTLFLDDADALPPSLHAALIELARSGRFHRGDGSGERTSAVRIVAAADHDPLAGADPDAPQHRLWLALGAFHIDVPALRERREDVLPLAEYLLVELCRELRRAPAHLSHLGSARLLRHPFPGNVRELRNVLERSLVLERGSELDLEELTGPPRRPAVVSSDPPDGTFRIEGGPITFDELGRRYARHVVAQMGGRRTEAARLLGLSYPTLLKRLAE